MQKSRILNIVLALVIIALLVIQQGRKETTPADSIKSYAKGEKKATKDTVKVEHKKRSFGPKNAIYPEPAMVIGTYDKNGTPNVMAASWFGIANSRPLKIAVSLRPATYSYHNIMENMAFTVNIPDASLAPFVSFVGKYSGKDMNKFEVTGYTPVKADSINAPYVNEFPIVLECRVTEYHDLGSHRQFIGQVIDTKIDEHVLTKKNRVDFDLFSPLIVGAGGYFQGGDYVGRGKQLRKVFEKKMKKE